MLKFPEDEWATLAEAKHWLEENLYAGVECPCCEQTARLRKVCISHSMVAVMAYMLYAPTLDKEPDGFIHVENYLVDIGCKIKGVHGKLKYWGLLEERPETDDPDKPRSGYWRLTPKGVRFLHRETLVPKFVFVFNDRLYAHSEETVDAVGAVNQKFDFAAIMQPSLDSKGRPIVIDLQSTGISVVA